MGGGTWNDGDIALCTAFGSSCDIIDKTTHKVTFRYGSKDMKNWGSTSTATVAMVKPNFFSEFETLPNGNIFTSNWQGHGGGNGGSGLQVLEFDPEGNPSGSGSRTRQSSSSIQGRAGHGRQEPDVPPRAGETSSDSTWQPVMNAP